MQFFEVEGDTVTFSTCEKHAAHAELLRLQVVIKKGNRITKEKGTLHYTVIRGTGVLLGRIAYLGEERGKSSVKGQFKVTECGGKWKILVKKGTE